MPICPLSSKFDFLHQFASSEGRMNLAYSCVPFGRRFKTYSAPRIANIYDFGFLFIVEKNTVPPGFTNSKHDLTIEAGSGTCSSISRHVMTS